ncbi:MAG: hemerythrin domain-containing protein [Pseudobacteriovorax sp.]|nr:hemerythrin domain-containing protein [Pseudobacteriovorax sp.]
MSVTILDLIVDEHQMFSSRLKEQCLRSEAMQRSFVEGFLRDFFIHDRAEEKVLYQSISKLPHVNKETQCLISSFYSDHSQIFSLISDLKDLPSRERRHRTNVLAENIGFHFKDEEERLFPVLSQLFSQQKLVDMGQLFLATKAEISGGLTLTSIHKHIASGKSQTNLFSLSP